MVEVRMADQLRDLKELLTSSGDISIAVAYVSSAGLALIEQEMVEGFSRGQKVRFLLNLDGRVTSPEAVNKLLELSRQYGRKLESKFFFIPNAVFHPKLYMSISENEIAFLSGSYNLTKSALKAGEASSNVEHGLWVRCTRTDSIGKQVLEVFENLWNDKRAVVLNRNLASQYAKAYADNRASEPQSTAWQSFLQYVGKTITTEKPSSSRRRGKPESPEPVRKNYWLFKCDIDKYSFDVLLRKDNKTDYWGDEIKSKAAQKIIMNRIRLDDEVLFYHSGDRQRAVVGTVRVVREAHLDPKTRTWQVVDIQADQVFRQSVTLDQLVQNPKLARQNWKGSQAILDIKEEEWDEIVALGKGEETP